MHRWTMPCSPSARSAEGATKVSAAPVAKKLRRRAAQQAATTKAGKTRDWDAIANQSGW